MSDKLLEQSQGENLYDSTKKIVESFKNLPGYKDLKELFENIKNNSDLLKKLSKKLKILESPEKNLLGIISDFKNISKQKEIGNEEFYKNVIMLNKEARKLNEEALNILKQNISKYKEIFKDNKEFFSILNNIEKSEDNTSELLENIKKLEDFFRNPENRKKIFDQLARTGDAELYKETYDIFANLSGDLKSYLSDIPKEIYKISKLESTKINEQIYMASFPESNGKVEKRGDIISSGDKYIDLKLNKAYIIGENGYKLETNNLANNIDKKQLSELEENYKKIEINNSLISKIDEILEELKEKDLNKEDIKAILKVKLGYPFPEGIQIDNYENIDNIKDNLKDKKDNLIKENEKLKYEQTKIRNKIIETIYNAAKESDEVVRERMRFLDSTGLSLLGEDKLKMFINKLNEINIKDENYFKIDAEKMDIPKEKKIRDYLRKSFNRLLTGEENKPLSMEGEPEKLNDKGEKPIEVIKNIIDTEFRENWNLEGGEKLERLTGSRTNTKETPLERIKSNNQKKTMKETQN